MIIQKELQEEDRSPLKYASPGFVLMDLEKKSVNLFELMVPSEENIDIINKAMFLKYKYFLSDITHTTLNYFEISSKGYLSPR